MPTTIARCQYLMAQRNNKYDLQLNIALVKVLTVVGYGEKDGMAVMSYGQQCHEAKMISTTKLF